MNEGKEYVLKQAKNGGWIVETDDAEGHYTEIVGAFSGRHDLLEWLAGHLPYDMARKEEAAA